MSRSTQRSSGERRTFAFYATPQDRQIIEQIQEIVPHYSFNHLTREGHRMLLRQLQQDQLTRPQTPVEYHVEVS